jgi:hypothetical protein
MSLDIPAIASIFPFSSKIGVKTYSKKLIFPEGAALNEI